MEGVDLEAVGSQESDPVAVAGMVLDPSSGPGDASDVALGAQQPVTGDPAFVGYAQGDRHAVGQEHQSARGSQEPGGLRQPVGGVAPRGGAVLADDEVERCRCAAEPGRRRLPPTGRTRCGVADIAGPCPAGQGSGPRRPGVHRREPGWPTRTRLPQPSSTMSRPRTSPSSPSSASGRRNNPHRMPSAAHWPRRRRP